MKIVSWNVNGIRAVVKKDFYGFLDDCDPDVLCFQETKAEPEQVQQALESMLGYELYAHSAQRKDIPVRLLPPAFRRWRYAMASALPSTTPKGG